MGSTAAAGRGRWLRFTGNKARDGEAGVAGVGAGCETNRDEEAKEEEGE